MATKTERKTCVICKRSKLSTNFFKIKSSLFFPDGRTTACSNCIKEQVEFSNQAIADDLLRQMNMPFIQEVWDVANEKEDGDSISYYVRLMHNPKYSSLTYKDSNMTEEDIAESVVRDDNGKAIIVDDDVMNKWGRDFGYSHEDYIKLEKFYRNMKYSYDISTPVQEEMLIEVSRLNIEKDALMKKRNFNDYKKASDVYKDAVASSGFRPVDKKSSLDEAGITSFGQVVQQIEKNGFIKPKQVEYEKDDIDAMLLFYLQWAQRFTEQPVSQEVPQDWKEQVDLSVDFMIDVDENKADAEKDYSKELLDGLEEEIGISSEENE